MVSRILMKTQKILITVLAVVMAFSLFLRLLLD